MSLYPLFLELSGRHILVVGAGKVGCRKIESLLPCEPKELLVLDPAAPGERLKQWMAQGKIRFCQRLFQPEDVEACALVFAATGDRATNARVAAACQARGIFCNSADAPASGSFLVPARVDRGKISLAVSTKGGSPALAALIRRDLELWLGESGYAPLAELLARLRPLILALNQDSGQNGDLFRRIAQSLLKETLARQDRLASEALLRDLLPTELHPRIMELLHELA